MTTHMRWLLRRDLRRVLEIELASFREGMVWSEEQFASLLAERHVIGMVAEIDMPDGSREIVGYMIYSLHPGRLSLESIAVDPLYRCRGVGRAMLQRLADKLSVLGRKAVDVTTSERSTGLHLFLRACGFRAHRVERDHYQNGEAAYLFRRALKVECQAVKEDDAC